MKDGSFAVFSDVHANLEAFEAILADLGELGIEKIICLGDTVGYGPDPAKCLKLVRELGCDVVRGNHDEALTRASRMRNMNDLAKAGLRYAAKALDGPAKEYLSQLPLIVTDETATYVHASLYRPGSYPYILDDLDALKHFKKQLSRVTFIGHTHTPLVCWPDPSGQEVHVIDGEGRIKLPGDQKILINVGSVGQPRDLCPDACYTICDTRMRWVEFRRVAYDIEHTIRKIGKANLPRFTGLRLLLGV